MKSMIRHQTSAIRIQMSSVRALLVGAGVIAALTVFLSVLGILAGKNPAPAAALGNPLGGLALAAAFAWIAGRSRGQGSTLRKVLPAAAAALVAVQCVLGAWLALRRDRAASRFALLGLALATPAAYACGRTLPLRGNEQTPRSAPRDPEG